MFCTQCGAKAPEASKFCHKCGAALPASNAPDLGDGLDIQVPIDDMEPVRPASTATPVAVAASPHSAIFDEEGSDEVERPWYMRPLPILTGLALLASFLIWGTRDFWMGPNTAQSVGTSAPDTPATVPADDDETSTYYALRTVKLRDKPTTQGSTVLGELKRGTPIIGTMEMAADGKTQWFKIKDSGQYVAAINLSDVAPPGLSLTLGKTMTLDEQTEIRAAPVDNATTIDTVGAGVKVDAVGVTSGWIEIALRKGGVGYIRPSSSSANFGLSSGEQVSTTQVADFGPLINFDAESCNFGSGMDRIFDAMRSSAGKGGFTVTGLPGDLVAKYDDPNNAEQSTLRLPIKGKYRGLTLVEVFISYEGNGLKFADSVDAVGTAFASSGFTKDTDGGYATAQDGVGGYITSEGGRTSLYCGA